MLPPLPLKAISIRELGERYGVSRQTLTVRLRVATFAPFKRGQQNWFLPEHVEELDRVHQLMNQGFSLADVEGMSGDNQVTSQTLDIQDLVTDLAPLTPVAADCLALLAHALAEAVSRVSCDRRASPLQSNRVLHETSERGYLLTSRQLAACLNVSPATTHHFNREERRFGFLLSKVGRGTWKVEGHC